MPKKQSQRKIDLSEVLLRGFYEDAVKNGIILLPDEAIDKLQDVMENLREVEKLDIPKFKRDNPRTDWEAIVRRLHHYAVDLYYDTYFGKKVGAPSMAHEYLEYIVSLKEIDKLSFGEIGIRIGESPESADKIRKQYGMAKKKGIKPSSEKSQD